MKSFKEDLIVAEERSDGQVGDDSLSFAREPSVKPSPPLLTFKYQTIFKRNLPTIFTQAVN